MNYLNNRTDAFASQTTIVADASLRESSGNGAKSARLHV